MSDLVMVLCLAVFGATAFFVGVAVLILYVITKCANWLIR